MSILNPQDWNRVEHRANAAEFAAELRQWEAKQYRDSARMWLLTADMICDREAKSMALDFAAEAHSRAVEIELGNV